MTAQFQFFQSLPHKKADFVKKKPVELGVDHHGEGGDHGWVGVEEEDGDDNDEDGDIVSGSGEGRWWWLFWKGL